MIRRNPTLFTRQSVSLRITFINNPIKTETKTRELSSPNTLQVPTTPSAPSPELPLYSPTSPTPIQDGKWRNAQKLQMADQKLHALVKDVAASVKGKVSYADLEKYITGERGLTP